MLHHHGRREAYAPHIKDTDGIHEFRQILNSWRICAEQFHHKSATFHHNSAKHSKKPGLWWNCKRLYSERLILGAKGVLLDLAKRGIIIHRIIAHSFTPGGIRLMKHIGFTETPPKAPALRDFMIDIESSGIPFLREYRKSLKYETILTGHSKKAR